jgi:(1->4)-alpha-D-glucan 1-alpha-D-glucosylmutase
MTPRATYRLQFHRDFPFAAGAKLAPYLASLGISHVYSSPILTARKGSLHGYDTIDHSRINPELGGEDGFRAMAEALSAQGLGIILDIVPNHMAVGGADNAWWLDVLENGPASAYAGFFDIEWDTPDPLLRGKVLAPFLGASLDEVLQAGEIRLVRDDALGKYAFAYFDHRFPLRREDYETVGADLSGFADATALHALLARQHFQLASWREASERINWRRFFDITDLAGLRIEDDRVFEAVHAIPLRLYGEGLIDGVRVDHVDGLADPAEYCRTLRRRLAALDSARPTEAAPGPAYFVVEKILASGEALPADWQVDGTTGYDFMNEVSALQHDAAGDVPLKVLWHEISGRSAEFEDEERAARREILVTAFAGQLAAAARAFRDATSDRTAPALATIETALARLIEHFRAYRTYATGRAGSPPPGPYFERALGAARQGAPLGETSALALIAAVMRNAGEASPLGVKAVRLFNQLTAPVAAKAVEDTALYRYARLLSRNDVGFDSRLFSLPPSSFHERCARRVVALSRSMLTTATHDHKRGEDVRARLAVLSEMPERWTAAVRRWSALNSAIRPADLGAAGEYRLYQTLVGVWSPSSMAELRERVLQWREKSMRESKLRSSWTDPDERYEAANRIFVEAIFDPAQSRAFLDDIARFVALLTPAATSNSLSQVALRCLLPGIPDLYQGGEYGDFSLVDPDNRRPVDFATRAATLSAEGLAVDGFDATKQALIAALLKLRAELPDLFAHGDYRPLPVRGRRADHVIAFARRHGRCTLVAVVPRCCAAALAQATYASPRDWWQDTAVDLQGISITRRVLPTASPTPSSGAVAPISSVLSGYPVCVLIASC